MLYVVFVVVAFGTADANGNPSVLALLIGGLISLYSLATLLPTIAVAVRRLHDAGQSGWMYLVGFIPVVGAFILIYFLIKPTSPEGDQYNVH